MQSTEEYLDQLLASVENPTEENSSLDTDFEKMFAGELELDEEALSILDKSEVMERRRVEELTEEMNTNPLSAEAETDEASNVDIASMLGLEGEDAERGADMSIEELIALAEGKEPSENTEASDPLAEILTEAADEEASDPLAEILAEATGEEVKDPLADLLAEAADEEAGDPLADLLAEAAGEEAGDPLADLLAEAAGEEASDPLADLLAGNEDENDPLAALLAESDEAPVRESLPDLDLDGEQLMDLEDVDALLAAAESKAAEHVQAGQEAVVFDEEMKEVDDLLAKADSDEVLEEDILAMLDSFDLGKNSAAEEIMQEDDAINKTSAKKEKKKKEKKPLFKKNKKNSVTENVTVEEVAENISAAETGAEPSEAVPEKKSLKNKVMNFMFEEGEEEEEEQPPVKEKKKKDKKDKKSKKDKNAKKASGEEMDENAAIAAELDAEDKKKKEKKPKKVKPPKQKKVKEPKEELPEKSHISKRGTFATLLACFSLLGVILVFVWLIPGQFSLMKARTCFYLGQYDETVDRMYGRKLGKSDSLLYKKAVILSNLENRYEKYEIYKKQGKNKEALDYLFVGRKAAVSYAVSAKQYGIESEWKLLKDKFEAPLVMEFGMTMEDIDAVCELRSLEYTIALENLLAGRKYDALTVDDILGGNTSPSAPETEEPVVEESKPEDLLPEEEALLQQLKEELEKQNSDTPVPEKPSENTPIFEAPVKDGEVSFTS